MISVLQKNTASIGLLVVLLTIGVLSWALDSDLSGSTWASNSSKAVSNTRVKTDLLPIERFLELLNGNSTVLRGNLVIIEDRWSDSYIPMLLEVGRFLPPRHRTRITKLIDSKTEKDPDLVRPDFDDDYDQWLQWNWKRGTQPHPNYGQFKTVLYSNIDPRFGEYFEETDNATIRLDEIRWGGVRRDGIPPLDKPEMLAADEADYLADTDVVFGIELNGDARAYPKRILAWHEMFKDTIGDESFCGVY